MTNLTEDEGRENDFVLKPVLMTLLAFSLRDRYITNIIKYF